MFSRLSEGTTTSYHSLRRILDAYVNVMLCVWMFRKFQHKIMHATAKNLFCKICLKQQNEQIEILMSIMWKSQTVDFLVWHWWPQCELISSISWRYYHTNSHRVYEYEHNRGRVETRGLNSALHRSADPAATEPQCSGTRTVHHTDTTKLCLPSHTNRRHLSMNKLHKHPRAA